MYAIIATGGKQYKVSEGDSVCVEKIAGEPGDAVVFDQVLAISDEGSMKAGADCAEVSLQVPAYGTRLTDLLTGAQYTVDHGIVRVPVELCRLHMFRMD
jgi:hypothetical protein